MDATHTVVTETPNYYCLINLEGKTLHARISNTWVRVDSVEAKKVLGQASEESLRRKIRKIENLTGDYYFSSSMLWESALVEGLYLPKLSCLTVNVKRLPELRRKVLEALLPNYVEDTLAGRRILKSSMTAQFNLKVLGQTFNSDFLLTEGYNYGLRSTISR